MTFSDLVAKENAIEIEDHTKESEATAEIIMMEATVVNESVREEEIQTPAEVQKIIIDVTAESDNGIPVASKRGNEIPVASLQRARTKIRLRRNGTILPMRK